MRTVSLLLSGALLAGALPQPGLAQTPGSHAPSSTRPQAQPATGSALCAATARHPTDDPRIATLVHEAQAQHQAFGGQAIDTAGRLVQAGYQEAEFDRAEGDAVPTWRKVQRFWEALGLNALESVRAADGTPVKLGPLRQSLQGVGLNAREASAADTSVVRGALVDNPWSAAFVSYLVRTAGFEAQEFTFSDAHADYVSAAYAANRSEQLRPAAAVPYAWRACDIARTPPRPGDLICHTRGNAAPADTFDKLDQLLAERRASMGRGPVAMHCDVVVAVDRGAAKMDSIGGNVMQSVTRRRLNLNAGRRPVLAAQYQVSQRPTPCLRAAGCSDRLMNYQPWAVLLQYRK
ncbi:MAG: DUF2272 domain-containing protein [Pseudomonadota bacterium]